MNYSPIDISFIIVNYNGFEDTSELLESMQKYSGGNCSYEIIVIDNGSKADESVKIKERFKNVSAYRSPLNLGFSGGYNLGIGKSSGRYIMLLNNDTLLEDNSIYGIVDFMDKRAQIGAASPKIYFEGDDKVIQYAGFTDLSKITLRNRTIGYLEKDSGQFQNSGQTSFTHGAAMVVRREVLEKAGLLPDIFFLYYEELDWCYRIRSAGFEIWYYAKAYIIHKESRSTGGGENSLKRYFKTRNRLLLAKRNREGLTRYLSYLYLVTLVAFKDITICVLKGRFDLFAATIKGIADFFRLKST